MVAVGKHARASSASVVLAFDENVATLVVADDGIGFDPERAVGFGRGQLRSRATQVGGQAEISSRTGGGTTVRVTIPLVALLRPLVPSDQGRAEPRAVQGSSTSSAGGGRAVMLRLLLVDDHPVVRAGLRGMLAGEPDLEVVGEAADGEEAVRISAELKPDVVLMDLRMPGIDGAEATRRIAALDPAPAVLVLTT